MEKMTKVDYSFGAPLVLAMAELGIKPEYKLLSECQSSFWSGKGSCMCNNHPSAEWEVKIPSWLAKAIKKNHLLNEEAPFGIEEKKNSVVSYLKENYSQFIS